MTSASPPQSGRLDVGVIGSGRVGAVLGAALSRVGHRVVAVSAVSDASRSRAETLLPDAVIVPPPEVCASRRAGARHRSGRSASWAGRGSGCGWAPGVRVSSSRMPAVATASRCSSRRAWLAPFRLALHPVMTFTGTSLDVDRLVGASFGVTAPTGFLPVADALVLEMEAEPVHIAEEARPLYHAALAHASNHLVTLEASSADLLRRPVSSSRNDCCDPSSRQRSTTCCGSVTLP